MKKLQWIKRPVGTRAIHRRIRSMFGDPSTCEKCGGVNSQIYDWANKDHKYKLNRKDWLQLCRSCHKKFDMKDSFKIKLSKPVAAYNKKGILVKKYISATEAAKELSTLKGTIWRALSGRRKTALGFCWRYL